MQNNVCQYIYYFLVGLIHKLENTKNSLLCVGVSVEPFRSLSNIKLLSARLQFRSIAVHPLRLDLLTKHDAWQASDGLFLLICFLKYVLPQNNNLSLEYFNTSRGSFGVYGLPVTEEGLKLRIMTKEVFYHL